MADFDVLHASARSLKDIPLESLNSFNLDPKSSILYTPYTICAFIIHSMWTKGNMQSTQKVDGMFVQCFLQNGVDKSGQWVYNEFTVNKSGRAGSTSKL